MHGSRAGKSARCEHGISVIYHGNIPPQQVRNGSQRPGVVPRAANDERNGRRNWLDQDVYNPTGKLVGPIAGIGLVHTCLEIGLYKGKQRLQAVCTVWCVMRMQKRTDIFISALHEPIANLQYGVAFGSINGRYRAPAATIAEPGKKPKAFSRRRYLRISVHVHT